MSLYSERFIVLSQPQTWLNVTIPTGTRAVVRSVWTNNGEGVAGRAQLAVSATLIWTHTFPANQTHVELDSRQVLYAGETLSGFVETQGIVLMVSGYLFREVTASRMPDGVYTDQLPAG